MAFISSKVVNVDESVIPETRRALLRLPIGDTSPCKLTGSERAMIVFYMSVETLEDIASCDAHMFVMTWQRRMGEWQVPARVTLPKIDRFRFGPIAHAVIAHAQNELAKRTSPLTE